VNAIRDAWSQTAAASRLAVDLPRFFRNPIDPDRCADLVRQKLRVRDERFLAVARKTIFTNARSPYSRLLRSAGCEWGDLARMVRSDGLDEAMHTLARRGVYVTSAELKGRRSIRRGSLQFSPRPGDFENPLIRPHMYFPTSGSTGSSRLLGRTLAERSEYALINVLGLRAHGVTNPVVVSWRLAPLTILDYGAVGWRTVGWFNPVSHTTPAVRAWQLLFVTLARMGGVRVPLLRSMPLAQPDRMLDWLVPRLAEHSEIVVLGYCSTIVRTALAATDRGLALHGVCFQPVGEPYTRERHAAIVATGARSIPQFGAMEHGSMSAGCAHPRSADDVHIATYRVAVIRRGPDLHGDDAGALAITTIDPTTPTVMFNTDLGDDADVVTRDCGCLMGHTGLTQHVLNIRPFERLTSEGVTFEGADIVAILERDLPAHCGGGPTDYQLAEEQSVDGRPRLVLRVHPRLGAPDVERIRTRFLNVIGAAGLANRHASHVLREAGTVEVVSQAPIATVVGKIPPFVPLAAVRARED
jgi:hypothetical protein